MYRIIAFVTDRFPNRGARAIDRLTFAAAGNRLVSGVLSYTNGRRLKHAADIRTICILCDMNIGDAVMTQAVAAAIRAYLPAARIDYVTKASAACLIEGNPAIDRVFGIYRGSPLPAPGDLAAIDELLAANAYDLVFTFCPFISRRNVGFPRHAAVIGYSGLAAEIIRAQRRPAEISHVAYRMFHFASGIFSRAMPAVRAAEFGGCRVTLSAAAVEDAARFLRTASDDDLPRVLYNPDTSSDFTRIPAAMQVRILSGLCDLPCRILLGAGQTRRGIETLLLDALPREKRAGIQVVPASLPIDAYAALIDECDLFVTGDTGPLHIAAAHKAARDGKHAFRNRTAVLSVYAAQPGRLYGYASGRPGYLSSSQDAPAFIYETKSSCRNMATVNKARIACRSEHFFQDLDIAALLASARQILLDRAELSLPYSSRSGRPPSGTAGKPRAPRI